jgi:hypothetical protein
MPQVSLNLPEREDKHLKRFCEITSRSQTDVVRELIRSLEIKKVLEPLS